MKTWSRVGVALSGMALFTVFLYTSLQTLRASEPTPPIYNYFSAQNPEWPPLPCPTVEGLTIYYLSNNAALMDDTSVDYAAIQAEAELLSALESEFEMSTMMLSSLASTIAYGNPVYLTNTSAMLATNALVTASFDIRGGTNFVPYDILTTTNVAAPISEWNWIGIGYTSNRYTFTNQPFEQSYYILGKPTNTMIVAWGEDAYEQCTVPFGISNAVAVAGGRYHSLALLNNGTVRGWGNNYFGQFTIPTNVTSATMIAATTYNSLALLTNGSVVGWGLHWPEVGYTLNSVPSDLTNATVVVAAARHALALRSNGTVVAWGYNTSGETVVPTNLTDVVAIAAGGAYCLAAKSNGTVVAWGQNSSGQCNVPTNLTDVVDVAAGATHSLALRWDGTLAMWGSQTNVPPEATNIVAIAAGGDLQNSSGYSLALRQDNVLIQWGNGAAIRTLAGFSNVIAIAAGEEHALAIRTGPRSPVLTLTPTNQYQVPGGSVTFYGRGAGLYAVSYQWKSNGVNIANATNVSFTLTNIQPNFDADYAIAVSNEVGTIARTAHLYVVTRPIIISQSPMPTNQTAIFCEPVTLSVVANATGATNGFPLYYQWKHEGTNLSSATASSFTFLAESAAVGGYSVVVTNAVGSTNAGWDITTTLTGSYIQEGTLAYHLATNAVSRTNGYTPSNMIQLDNWTWDVYSATNMSLLTNSIWATNFWLRGVQGLSATCIGLSNNPGGQGLVTMISPRHCIFATHMHGTSERFVAAFLDTNNVIHWRRNVETVAVANDISVGILDADLPASVGYLPLAPPNSEMYLPTNSVSFVQGIGMNQDMKVFSQPMAFYDFYSVTWTNTTSIPFGVPTDWSIRVRGGDSSGPARLLIGNQLVLVSHNSFVFGGPKHYSQIDGINAKLHYLSTNNSAASDYQSTLFSFTNWPQIH